MKTFISCRRRRKETQNSAEQPAADGRRSHWRRLLIPGLLAALLAGCSFAPKYQRPSTETPAAFKELAPETATNGWQAARPSDAMSRGKWWEIFDDPQLNRLEEQVSVANQNVASAFANFLSARAMVKEAHAQLY